MKENMRETIKERLKLSSSGVWLLTCVFAVILPVFLSSYADSQSFVQNVIGASTVSMFILSFPSSLFGLPMMFFVGLVLGVDANSLEGMYLNLFLLFVLGLIQWFWILPQVWRNEPRLQTLNLLHEKCKMQFLEAKPENRLQTNDFQDYTPLERVIYGKEEV